jgi:hypothetical protein
MPVSGQLPTKKGARHEWLAESMAEAFAESICSELPEDKNIFSAVIQESIKRHGFVKTLKELQRFRASSRRRIDVGMHDIQGGVLEITDHGRVDAALDTKEGKRMVVTGWRTDDISSDVQTATEGTEHGEPLAPDQLLSEIIKAGDNVPSNLICEAEFAIFDLQQKQVVLPLLWKYIVSHIHSKRAEELIATASAIRKYIAIMPMDRMGDLSILIAPGNHDPLPLPLELEVIKMIFRNFEVHPPEIDPYPDLALLLLNIAKAYVNPIILLRDKHSAIAVLAIEAIVAMRSSHSLDALSVAANSQYRWLGEMVYDDLRRLRAKWASQSSAAAPWLDVILAQTGNKSETVRA